MDQQKIGTFLKALRKDKGMTQIELAEKLHVAGRTVSRWETGVCLPDLDILTELADLYHVEIREIIEGRRKMKTTTQQQAPNLQALADYSRQREQLMVRQVFIQSICGILAWGISLILMLRFSEISDGIPILLGMEFFTAAVYTLIMHLIPANRTANGCISVLTAGFCAITASNLAILGIFFWSGTYHNWGLIGVWYCAAVLFICFLVAGVIVTFFNSKDKRAA